MSMIRTKAVKFLLVGIAVSLFAQFAHAEMTVNLNGGVLTITDIGFNPDSSFTVAINRNGFVVVRTSNDDFTDTIQQNFRASDVEQIRFFTGDGDDQVVFRTAINVEGGTIVQSYLEIDVHIQTGAGEDRVFVFGAEVGDLSIQTGTEDDLVEISQDSIVKDLLISTSSGNDEVSIDEIDVLGATEVFTGAGDDSLETYRSVFLGHALIDAGPNLDEISIGGPSSLTKRQNRFVGTLDVMGGTGADRINVDNGDYALMRIEGGLGVDRYFPYGSFEFDRSFRLSNVETCRPEFPYGSHHVYKTVASEQLEMIVVKPEDWEPSDSRPAILFFHGGSWVSGSPLQFRDHAHHFATQGMVCILVQYRLLELGVRIAPEICINDSKSAMRFVRSNASVLGVNPDRIASCGGSAGGHLAAWLGTTDGLDDPQDDLGVSARPNAMCLFAPISDMGPMGIAHNRVLGRHTEFSPMHNISSDDAPHIVLLGSEDHIVPTSMVSRFRRLMLEAGVQSELRIYEGAGHSFFLQSFDREFYNLSLTAMERFLGVLGWFDPPSSEPPVVIGDVNFDGVVNFLDIAPFIEALSGGEFVEQADTDQDGSVSFFDIDRFIALLSGM